MNAVGYMSMPEQFRYRDVFLRGKPQHAPLDRFSIKHPPMDVGKRAKIFAPFDALKGFNEAVAAKEIPYTYQIALTEEDKEELNRKLAILHNLTYNSRMARQNNAVITVTYYVPCGDVFHEAYGVQGLYKSVTGVCRRVDCEINMKIVIDGITISLDTISKIVFSQKLMDKLHLEEC